MTEAVPPTDAFIVRANMNNGDPVALRRIQPADQELLRSGILSLSPQSRYLRFFSPAPMVPEPVLRRLADVDGADHLAWVAVCVDCEVESVAGVVHAIRNTSGGPVAEYAVTVIDPYQGQGVARMLTAALLVDCLTVGIAQLDVQILRENHAAGALIRSMGAVHRETSSGVSDYILPVDQALEQLRGDRGVAGIATVLQKMEPA